MEDLIGLLTPSFYDPLFDSMMPDGLDVSEGLKPHAHEHSNPTPARCYQVERLLERHDEEPVLKKPPPRPLLPKKTSPDGLENLTRRTLGVLQTSGTASFDTLQKALGVDSRRLYDVLNVVTASPLVRRHGKKRERMPFQFGDGKPLTEPVPLEHLLYNIELEQEKILQLLRSRPSHTSGFAL
ncbi:E2F/DP family winged-helix DNA-binding domain-containing protein [Giardia muris]|uniref:E2F/DP family winged-helix DNA-binding domain-containing protein n=1 Tax=Giardia muris TaxID=5742 RepID=A0A4Z1T9W5_GIAMU|nr:E2F/DP family winged-helix DNA-binding domain-containing protein [Giardia muris]|eukprot:TNJ29311.1 E2F/DP family winged-helix DNA-binding domain-containing protein [Giardia muris]